MVTILITLIVFILITCVLWLVARAMLGFLNPPRPQVDRAVYAILLLIMLLLFLARIGWIPSDWAH